MPALGPRLPPHILNQPVGWFHAGQPTQCPNNYLWECQNSIVKSDGIHKRDIIVAQTNENLASGKFPRFVFYGNKTNATVQSIIVVTAAEIYGRAISAGSWTTIASSRSTPTYASVATFGDKLYIFDNANDPGYWDFSTTYTSLTNKPSERCAEVILHKAKGFMVACQAATNKDYVFIGFFDDSEIIDFTMIKPLRVPDNRGGFKALRLFSYGEFVVILTDYSPVLLYGTGQNNFRLYPQAFAPGMRTDALRCACLGAKGVYYLDKNLHIQRFDGQDAHNITLPYFEDYIVNDIRQSVLSTSCMWADGNYIYFSYASNEIGATAVEPDRIIVFDELRQRWVSDIRGYNISHAATPYKTSIANPNIGRWVDASYDLRYMDAFPERRYFDVTFPVEYDGSVEPDAATPVWTLVGSDLATSDGDILTIDTFNQNTACHYSRAAFSSETWTLECRVKVLNAHPDTGVYLVSENSTDGVALYFREGSIILRATNDGSTLGTYSIDTVTSYHIYRMTRNNTNVRVYVDENATPVIDVIANVGAPGSPIGVAFGDEVANINYESLVKWDYVKYNDGQSHGAESFSSIIETREYDGQIGMLKDYGEIETETDVQSSGSLTVKLLIDSEDESTAPSRSISLTASGQRYGDEDTETVTRRKTIVDVWQTPHNSTYITSGRRAMVRYEHTGADKFRLGRSILKSNISISAIEKERAK